MALLRYPPGGDGQSEVDTQNYFLSPNGKKDWKQEWDESLAQLLRPLAPDENVDLHPRCRFPARTRLIEKLTKQSSPIKEEQCVRFQALKEKITLKKVFLVFAGQYVARPASAFGHTFFRLETTDNSNDNPHLDYGLDFAAQVTTENPLIYGIMGITGGFWGRFGLMPYTRKLSQYQSLDRRDLFEYEIPLSQEKLDMFVAHLFEMDHAGFDYFYLTENCSYHVMRFLEAISPELKYSSRLHPIVIPADTLHSFVHFHSDPQIIYRPGSQIQFANQFEKLSTKEKIRLQRWSGAFPQYSMDDLTSFAELKTALLWLDTNYADEMLVNPTHPAAKAKWLIAQKMIAERQEKTFDLESQEELSSLPEHAPPHWAMPSRRLSLGWAQPDGKEKGQLQFQYRWSLSAWDEWAKGRLRNTTLEMGDLVLDSSSIFKRLYLLNLRNRQPLSLFNQNISYGLTVGAHDIDWTSHHEISPYLGIQMGLAAQISILDLAIFLQNHLEHPHLSPGVSRWQSRFGPLFEFKLSVSDSLHLSGQWQEHRDLINKKSTFTVYDQSIKLNQAWSPLWANSLEARRIQDEEFMTLQLHHYF